MADDVTVDMSPLKRFARAFAAGMAGAPGPINDMWLQIGDRILTFWGRRFDIFSAGGGDWAPLTKATKQRKQKRADKGRPSARSRRAIQALRSRGVAKAGESRILKDTGQLRQALGSGSKGNVLIRIPNGIRVGIGGEDSHSDAGMTIGRLAEIHHKGLGHNPKRKIVIKQLDKETIKGIQTDVKRAVGKLGRIHGGKFGK